MGSLLESLQIRLEVCVPFVGHYCSAACKKSDVHMSLEKKKQMQKRLCNSVVPCRFHLATPLRGHRLWLTLNLFFFFCEVKNQTEKGM